MQYKRVVPYIGTWIETTEIRRESIVNAVVPYIGTWIETKEKAVLPYQ